jgi:DNA (cytosine-5)-methyltransferase 1
MPGGKYKVLSLFAGIGGFDLGLERTGGFETVAFCEIEPFAVRILNKHWPEVAVYGDVRELTAERLAADGIAVDVICGGFPCQDISSAGLGAGLEGERSGLWSEFARLIGELRPRYVLVENVANLLSLGMGRVLGDLAALRYDAEWHCIPASAVGALHRRDRVWIVAHPALLQRDGGDNHAGVGVGGQPLSKSRDDGGPLALADAERGRPQGGHEQRPGPTAIIPPAFGRYCGGGEFGEAWRVEPNVGRVAHGVPDAMDRLKGCGNAVVPQIPELIGRAILNAEAA